MGGMALLVHPIIFNREKYHFDPPINFHIFFFNFTLKYNISTKNNILVCRSYNPNDPGKPSTNWEFDCILTIVCIPILVINLF